METSDSECFESADEEFLSDNEDLSSSHDITQIDKLSFNDPNTKTTQSVDLSKKDTFESTESKKKNNVSELESNQDKHKRKLHKLQSNESKIATVDDQECTIKCFKDNLDLQSKQLHKEQEVNITDIVNKEHLPTTKADMESQNELINCDKNPNNFSVESNIKTNKKIEENESIWKNNEDCYTSEELVKKTDVEENMWGDDEDWGHQYEQVKEKQHQHSKPVVSKECISQKEAKTNMWEDDWEPFETQDKLQNKPVEDNSGWGAWGNWGISSVISTASSLTSQVSQGITSVLESSIGVPNPEELAKIHKDENVRKCPETVNENSEPNASLGFGLGNFVSGVTQITKLVEETGTKVISGGLDTLETIGKKTMEVLQENDPGLKNKRAFLKIEQDKPILSQVLRDAKEKAESENKAQVQKHFAKKANYETLFDDHQGLVHLEALEMLSKQCDIKLQTLFQSYSGNELTEMQETIEQVKELCELPEEDEEELVTMSSIKGKLEDAVTDININITYKKLIATWQDVDDWLSKINLCICNENEIHQQAIEALAQLTAISVEQFHKAGELLLIKEHRSTADEADSLVQLTTSLTTLIATVAGNFSEKLNQMASTANNKENVNSLITNVFFEAANSSSYVKDAFKLLIPVLQVGAV